MAFWHPGTERPAQPIDPDGDATPVYNPLSGFSIDVQRRRLPIFEHRQALLYAVTQNGVTIVVADVGAGKSTQIPQYLHESGWTAGGRMIACTQPRRVATKTVAARVAEEMGVRLGHEVGYSIRFDDMTHPTLTRIKFVTDGMLLREMLVDPLLRRYSVVMVDEAHERSLQSDVLMGLLRKVRRVRPTLRVIISSATLEADRFRDFFDASAEADAEGLPLPPASSAAAALLPPPTGAGDGGGDDGEEDDVVVVELLPAQAALLPVVAAGDGGPPPASVDPRAAAAASRGRDSPPAVKEEITSYPVVVRGGGVGAAGAKRRRPFRSPESDSSEDEGAAPALRRPAPRPQQDEAPRSAQSVGEGRPGPAAAAGALAPRHSRWGPVLPAAPAPAAAPRQLQQQQQQLAGSSSSRGGGGSRQRCKCWAAAKSGTGVRSVMRCAFDGACVMKR